MPTDADPPQRPWADAGSRHEPADDQEKDRLSPSRGILVGLLLATIFWIILIAAIVFWR